jgi:beta-lactamase class A
MAHDDPYNPSSAPLGRLGNAGEPASTNGNPGSPAPVDRSNQGHAAAATPPGLPDKSAEADGLSRPSLVSRRRNQWRQYKHMTPDFGPTTAGPRAPGSVAPGSPALSSTPHVSMPPALGSEFAPPSAREAALPSFKLRPGAPPAASPVPAQATSAQPLPQGRPLQIHPHSSPAATWSAPAAPPPKVTPLRPLPRRPQPQAARLAAQSLADTTAGSGGTMAPTRTGSAPVRSRQGSPRQRLPKPPLPVLYLIRLVILGVGVAAIAGTLLSILSPSNVASPSREGGATATPATPTPGRALVGGRGATTIADLQPTSELTRLKAQLEQLVTLTPGLTPALYALDLDSGRYVDLEGSKAVAAASTIKVPILIAFLQQVDAGNIALNQALALQESHMAGGSGTLANDAVGSEYTALDVATRMIVSSDNTATNMLMEALGGPETLNQQFLSWGLESTALRNPLPDLDGTNTISTRDLALLMALVDQGGLLSPRSRDRLFSIMQRTINRSLIPFSLTDGSIVANKTGDIALALGDVALVDTPKGQRYVLALMVQRPNNDGRASELIRRLTETTHTELNQPIAPVGRPSPGTPDPTGEPPATEAPNGGTEGSLESAPDPGPAPARDQVPPG